MASLNPLDTPAAARPPTARRCENCGEPLYGEHCHSCGQPTQGLVRHFSTVLGDFSDTVFNIDSRVLRTLWPLLARPGFLSLEYFAGRRVRYVTPTRLFLFLSLLGFLAIQASVNVEPQGGPDVQLDSRSARLGNATTPAQVRAIRDEALAELKRAQDEAAKVPGAAIGLQIAAGQINEVATAQLAWMEAAEKARSSGKPPPARPQRQDNEIDFPINGRPWHPQTNPVDFSWLPAPVNAMLNRRLGHARDVLKSNGSEQTLLDAMFNVLPQTLIVLMPLFALMLKVAYWFRRRLYMEHLIVALHSHSFISLALILVMLFSALADALSAGFLQTLMSWAAGLMTAWIPLYLLLMQKRVYAQGWPMTLLKNALLGVCYSVLLAVGLVAAVLIGLLTL